MKIIGIILLFVIFIFILNLISAMLKRGNKNKLSWRKIIRRTITITITSLPAAAIPVFTAITCVLITTEIEKKGNESTTSTVAESQKYEGNYNDFTNYHEKESKELGKIKATQNGNYDIPENCQSKVDKQYEILNNPSNNGRKEQIRYLENLLDILPYNPKFINRFASEQLEYAKDLYKQQKFDECRQYSIDSAGYYKSLLKFTNPPIAYADIYYRMAQCFEYYSECCDFNSQEACEYQIKSAVYYTFSREDASYEKSTYHGYSYYYSALLLHRIGMREDVGDYSWLLVAQEDYQHALLEISNEIPENDKRTCKKSCNKGLAAVYSALADSAKLTEEIPSMLDSDEYIKLAKKYSDLASNG